MQVVNGWSMKAYAGGEWMEYEGVLMLSMVCLKCFSLLKVVNWLWAWLCPLGTRGQGLCFFWSPTGYDFQVVDAHWPKCLLSFTNECEAT